MTRLLRSQTNTQASNRGLGGVERRRGPKSLLRVNTVAVVRCKRSTYLGETVAERLGRFHGHAPPPGHEVLANFLDAAGIEVYRQRAIGVLSDRLAWMESKRFGVARRVGVETERHIDGLFLKGSE